MTLSNFLRGLDKLYHSILVTKKLTVFLQVVSVLMQGLCILPVI